MMNNYYNNPDYAEGAFVNLIGDVGPDYTLAFKNDYIGILGWQGGWVELNLLPYQEDTWYFVSRTLTLFGDGTSTGSFYVEEVGNPTNNASYIIGSNYENHSIDSIWIITSNTHGTDCYIDELNISSSTDLPPNPIPEPATMLLLSSGIIGLAGFRKKFKKA